MYTTPSSLSPICVVVHNLANSPLMREIYLHRSDYGVLATILCGTVRYCSRLCASCLPIRTTLCPKQCVPLPSPQTGLFRRNEMSCLALYCTVCACTNKRGILGVSYSWILKLCILSDLQAWRKFWETISLRFVKSLASRIPDIRRYHPFHTTYEFPGPWCVDFNPCTLFDFVLPHHLSSLVSFLKIC